MSSVNCLLWLSGADPETEVGGGGGILIFDRGYIELCGPNSKKGVLHKTFFSNLDALRGHILYLF